MMVEPVREEQQQQLLITAILKDIEKESEDFDGQQRNGKKSKATSS